MFDIKSTDVAETKKPETTEFKEIKPETDISPKEARKFWDNEFASLENDGLYTSLENRVNEAGKSDGTWSGDVGNSKFSPSDLTDEGIAAKNKLSEFGLDGIEFKNGIPDFSKIAVEAVEIDMTGDRSANYTKTYTAVANKWNSEKKDGRSDWTAREVKEWKQLNNLSPHECSDMKTVQFVPTSVHSFVKHYGGVAECKARDNILNGGKFDE